MLIVIVGATGTGKSGLSLDLADVFRAEGRAVEIVNADAMQLYRGMDIGTAKLPVDERRGIPHHLLDVPGLTVATNSIKIADVLRERHTVVLIGGVRTPSDALVGPVANLVLRSLHFDVAFLGCHGMAAVGLTTPNLAEAETNRAFVRAARQLVVVADSTKWGTVGVMTFAELSDVAVLVTDDGIDADARSVLDRCVGTLQMVSVGSLLGAAR